MGCFEAEVNIIDACHFDHRAGNDGDDDAFPVIELFGRCREGQSVTLLCPRVFPYCHILDPTADVRAQLKDDPRVKRLKDVRLVHESREVPALKVILYAAGDMAEFGEKHGAIASDISLHQRFWYDRDLGYCVRVRGLDMQSRHPHGRTYGTDSVVMLEEIHEVAFFESWVKILSIDTVRLAGGEILCVGLISQSGPHPTTRVLDGDEKSIIENLCRIVREEDYDILSGRGISDHQLPDLAHRARTLGLRLDIGRDGSEPQIETMSGTTADVKEERAPRGPQRLLRIAGRCIVDTLSLSREEGRFARTMFSDLSDAVMGHEEPPRNPNLRYDWLKDPDQVKRQSIEDALRSHTRLVHSRVLDTYECIADAARLPLQEALSRRPGVFADSLLIREADRQSVAVPNMKRQGIDAVSPGEDRCLQQPVPGLHDRVVVIAGRLLYAGIIVLNNICPTTISEEGGIASPVGVRFLSQEIAEGILPKVMRKLLNARRDSRRRAAAAESKEEAEKYARHQRAQEVLADAVAEEFRSSSYRFTDRRIAGAITAFASEGIKSMARTLQCEGQRVAYADTESLFVISPYKTRRRLIAFSSSPSAECRKLQPEIAMTASRTTFLIILFAPDCPRSPTAFKTGHPRLRLASAR